MAKTRIAALLSVLALLASLPLTVALAQGAPYAVVGTAMVDGKPAMTGTMVVAMVSEEKVGAGEVFNDQGQYRLSITGGNMGDTLTICLMIMTEYTAMSDAGDITIGNPGELTTANLITSTNPPAQATTAPRSALEVFEELGDRLVRVWRLDRATQTWSFYDPDPAVAAFNTLSEVAGGNVVSVIISPGDPVQFQGQPLYAGNNPISLE